MSPYARVRMRTACSYSAACGEYVVRATIPVGELVEPRYQVRTAGAEAAQQHLVRVLLAVVRLSTGLAHFDQCGRFSVYDVHLTGACRPVVDARDVNGAAVRIERAFELAFASQRVAEQRQRLDELTDRSDPYVARSTRCYCVSARLGFRILARRQLQVREIDQRRAIDRLASSARRRDASCRPRRGASTGRRWSWSDGSASARAAQTRAAAAIADAPQVVSRVAGTTASSTSERR